MVGQKKFGKFAVFLVILLCLVPERSLSEAELVCVCSTPWSSSSISSSSSMSQSSSSSSATPTSYSSSSSSSMSQSSSSSSSMSQSSSSSSSVSQSISSSSSMSQSSSSSSSVSQSISSSFSVSPSSSSSSSESQSSSSSSSVSQSISSSSSLSSSSSSSSSVSQSSSSSPSVSPSISSSSSVSQSSSSSSSVSQSTSSSSSVSQSMSSSSSQSLSSCFCYYTTSDFLSSSSMSTPSLSSSSSFLFSTSLFVSTSTSSTSSSVSSSSSSSLRSTSSSASTSSLSTSSSSSSFATTSSSSSHSSPSSKSTSSSSLSSSSLSVSPSSSSSSPSSSSSASTSLLTTSSSSSSFASTSSSSSHSSSSSASSSSLSSSSSSMSPSSSSSSPSSSSSASTSSLSTSSSSSSFASTSSSSSHSSSSSTLSSSLSSSSSSVSPSSSSPSSSSSASTSSLSTSSSSSSFASTSSSSSHSSSSSASSSSLSSSSSSASSSSSTASYLSAQLSVSTSYSSSSSSSSVSSSSPPTYSSSYSSVSTLSSSRASSSSFFSTSSSSFSSVSSSSSFLSSTSIFMSTSTSSTSTSASSSVTTSVSSSSSSISSSSVSTSSSSTSHSSSSSISTSSSSLSSSSSSVSSSSSSSSPSSSSSASTSSLSTSSSSSSATSTSSSSSHSSSSSMSTSSSSSSSSPSTVSSSSSSSSPSSSSSASTSPLPTSSSGSSATSTSSSSSHSSLSSMTTSSSSSSSSPLSVSSSSPSSSPSSSSSASTSPLPTSSSGSSATSTSTSSSSSHSSSSSMSTSSSSLSSSSSSMSSSSFSSSPSSSSSANTSSLLTSFSISSAASTSSSTSHSSSSFTSTSYSSMSSGFSSVSSSSSSSPSSFSLANTSSLSTSSSPSSLSTSSSSHSSSSTSLSSSSTSPTSSLSVSASYTSSSSSSDSASSASTDSIQPTSSSSVHEESTVAPDPCSFLVCQNGGSCKVDNNTAMCDCAPGFNGSRCEEDIDECASGPCQNNATCHDGVNSFTCNCSVGYVGDYCGYVDPCLNNPCKNNGTCYVDAASNYSFFCVCPIPKAYTGQDCGTPVQCFWDIMYPYGEEQGDQEIPVVDDSNQRCTEVSINSNFGLYFFERQHYELFICPNGMISFDTEWTWPRPVPTYNVEDFPFDFAMLTPFWSKIDYRQSFCSSPQDCGVNYVNRSVVYYQVYTQESLTQKATDILGNASEQVKNNQPAFHDFSATWVLVVTWLRLRPEDLFKEGVEEEITNTFQAVLITNGTYSFMKYHYPCGSVEWSAPPYYDDHPDEDYDGFPVAGYNAGDDDFSDIDKKYPSLDGSGSYDAKYLDDAKDVDSNPGYTGRRGEYCFRIEDRKGDDATAKCFIWHKQQETSLKSELLTKKNSLRSCPCSFWQALFDGRFYPNTIERDNFCFLSRRRVYVLSDLDADPVSAFVQQRCCYRIFDINWALDSDASYLQVSYSSRPDTLLDDETAASLCCDESDNCHEFYDVRPRDDCAGYRPLLFIFFWGDPHFNTLDGANYTFNGVGEYTMVKTENSTFVLQARTKPAQGEQLAATIFSAGVAKEASSSKAEVRIKDGGGVEMYIDETLYADFNTLNNISKDIGGDLYAKKVDNCVEVAFPSGTGVKFCESKGMMTFVTTMSSDYFNKTKGLLGTYNGNSADDFTLPNGTVLSPSMTPKEIHYDFGLKWQITGEESLFAYGPNENVSTFQNASFTPMFVDDIVWVDNNTRDEAERKCGGDVVCLFDAAATNDVSIGVNSQEVSVQLVKESQQLENFPPRFTYVPSFIEANLGQVAFINVTASDNNTFNFSVPNKPKGASYSTSGNLLNFTWNVTSSEKVKISFLATDELGAAVSSTPSIKMCACKNGGQCVAPKVGDKYSNDSKFIYQGCSCSSGWTGRFCESDIDACALSGQPCFKGSKCKDLPPPHNITGYQCGPCPSGYSGDGVNCVDINECKNSSLNSCEQDCTNSPGSYVCSCYPGYKLNSNKHSCDDINECKPTNDCMHKCNNTIGSYICYCKEFFVVSANNNKSCDPSYPCSSDDCSQVCYKKQDGTQACDCNAGYQLGNDGKTCEDIDECKIPGVKCTHECKNLDGKYECKCYPGYKLEADGYTCTDINECLNPSLFSCPGSFRVCENIPGNYTCKCQDGLFFKNNTCQALKKGEKPPEPTVPPPKPASEKERQNSVEVRATNMTKDQYNATVDKNFKETMAAEMDNYCTQNKAACNLTSSSKRKRRALGIFTSDNVHLVPGFPVQDNNDLRILFYILLPSNIQEGGVISAVTLLQVVNNSKSALETLLRARINEIKLGYVPTTPPPTTNASNATTPSVTEPSQTPQTPQATTDKEDDDWKWIVVGVVLGVLVIVIIVAVVVVIIRKKKQNKVDISGDNEGQNSFRDENANRGQERHEMMTYHGQSAGQSNV